MNVLARSQNYERGLSGMALSVFIAVCFDKQNMVHEKEMGQRECLGHDEKHWPYLLDPERVLTREGFPRAGLKQGQALHQKVPPKSSISQL